MKLFTYWRSSASYRVRIGLNLKGLTADQIPVHMLKDGGEQHKSEYRAMNSQGLVPTLELDDGDALVQSMAILEYLDEVQPEPALLPGDAKQRAHIRAVSQALACETHPLCNLRVLQYLTGPMALSEDKKMEWIHHWVQSGLEAVEDMVKRSGASGKFCVGDAPTLADLCLVPQFYNARRFNVDLSNCPTILAIDENCLAHPAFDAAAPDNQPDAG